MRISKLTLAAVFSAAAVFGPALSQVQAAEPASDADITIQQALNGSYNVYQLFTGTFTPEGNLGDLTVNPAYKADLLKAIQHFDASFTLDAKGSESDQANALAEKMQTLCGGENTAQGRAFANYLAGILQADPTAVVQAENGTLSLQDQTTGYYLITAAADNTTARTSAILLPAKSGDNTITLKATQPAAHKTAVGHGQSGPGASSVDQEISDGKILSPTYTIQGTVASNIADFSTYPYQVVDTLPEGVTTTAEEVKTDWKVSVSVASGSKTASVDSQAQTSVSAAGNVITWSFTDLKKTLEEAGIAQADLAASTVSVTYTPVLDEQDLKALYSQGSVLSSPFTNTAQVVFASDPYAGGEGKTSPTDPNTPGSQVKTYSWNLKLSKIDQDKKPVTGAAFEITDPEGHVIGNNITAADDGSFLFTGLKAGVEYTLKETAVPAGYLAIDPVTFTITENKEADGTVSSIAVTKTSDPDKAAAFTTQDASVNGVIVNLTGPVMPSTGQSGVLLVGAAGTAVAAISAMVILRKKK